MNLLIFFNGEAAKGHRAISPEKAEHLALDAHAA
jgi:hypothetical protein